MTGLVPFDPCTYGTVDASYYRAYQQGKTPSSLADPEVFGEDAFGLPGCQARNLMNTAVLGHGGTIPGNAAETERGLRSVEAGLPDGDAKEAIGSYFASPEHAEYVTQSRARGLYE